MSDAAAPDAPRALRFFRAGGIDQPRIDSGADVVALPQLDQKLWIALACPTRGVEFDPRSLDVIDANRDGRIRAPELIAAARWIGAALKDPEALIGGRAALALSDVNPNTPEGAAILASARRALAALGKPDSDVIALEDVADPARLFPPDHPNGDGIVPPALALAQGQPDIAQALAEAVAAGGGEADRSGALGVNAASATAFFDAVDARVAWLEGEADAAGDLGGSAPAAAAALTLVGAKVEDYFQRCRLAAYDPQAEAALNGAAEDWRALAACDLAAERGRVAAFPLARIAAHRPLPLLDGLNPAWEEAMAALLHDAVIPALGAAAADLEVLSEADWRLMQRRVAPYLAWLAAEPPAPEGVRALAPDRLRALARPEIRAGVTTLIALDLSAAPAAAALAEVEKALRLVRDLHPLLNNFVAFRDFYARKGKAAFQAGTLYIDGRACELCVDVADIAAHAELAAKSRIYLLYCKLTRPNEPNSPRFIAAAVTAGHSDNLSIGRNGLFYDRQGRDWDAVVVKIIDHPISLRQAMLDPYRRVTGFMGEQLGKLAAARAVATQSEAQKLATGVAAPAAAGAAVTAAAPSFDPARLAGIFAAFGLALGAIGTAVASVVTGFMNLAWWEMPLAILGLAALISGPSMLIAALKLRERTLGPILDACGWAVNASTRINIPFGTALTQCAALPPGAERALTDPYADRPSRWRWWVAGALLLVALIAGLRYGGAAWLWALLKGAAHS